MISKQVNCGIGRDSVEAWGRKKRSINGKESSGSSGKQLGDDMTLSREIVVLDLKEKDPSMPDDGSSLTDNDQSSNGAQKSPLKSTTTTTGTRQQDSSSIFSSTTNSDGSTKHCLTSQSLFVLTCSIGLFFILYVCVVAYFFARRDPKISPIKHQYH